ncbi:MAG: hypothetical protein IH957_08760 [Chloroflexi bacterium]|nr:hypothetical protein [Chloroflexota bacterium]
MYRAVMASCAVALLAACAGESAPGSSPTLDFQTAASDAVVSALVTLDELPEFWTEVDAADAEFEIELSPECDVFDTDVSFPGAVATEEGPPYNGPGERLATFMTAAFREEQQATDAFDGIDEIIARCQDEFLEAIEETARAEAADRGFDLGVLARVNVDFSEHDFIPLGDQSLAQRVSVEIRVIGIGTDFTLDVIAVRKGRMIGTMTYSDFGELEVAEEEAFARQMTEKLTIADLSLPE